MLVKKSIPFLFSKFSFLLYHFKYLKIFLSSNKELLAPIPYSQKVINKRHHNKDNENDFQHHFFKVFL